MPKLLKIAALAALSLLAGLALSSPVALGNQRIGDLRASLLELQGNRDVALTSIEQVGPPFAHQGNTVTIALGITNNGSQEETFNVSLHDDTDGVAIGVSEVTVPAKGSLSLDFRWDTSGATGGPPPPGPPTPGTIHVLTASADLDGDTSPGNNSISLLPGIWIIAAPTNDEVTFPNGDAEPQASYGKGEELDRPGLDVSVLPLNSLFIGYLEAFGRFPVTSPDIATTAAGLVEVFNTVTTGSATADLSPPGIGTVIELPVRILYDALLAGVELPLLAPAIATAGEPAGYVLVENLGPRLGEPLTVPGIGASRRPLAGIFTGPSSASSRHRLRAPALVTEAPDTAKILSSVTDATSGGGFSRPAVGTPADSLESLYSVPVSADAYGGLAETPLGTIAEPSTEVLPVGAQSDSNLPSGRPRVGAKPSPLATTFISKGTVTHSANLVMAGPFDAVTVRGTIDLEGRGSSLGSYVETGDEVIFANEEGKFEATLPEGAYTIALKAPGYLPLTMETGKLAGGDTLTLPPVTLYFGDVNEDEVIDIFDLTVAARNFGRATWLRDGP